MTCSCAVPTQEVALGSPTMLESEAVAELRVPLMLQGWGPLPSVQLYLGDISVCTALPVYASA